MLPWESDFAQWKSQKLCAGTDAGLQPATVRAPRARPVIGAADDGSVDLDSEAVPYT